MLVYVLLGTTPWAGNGAVCHESECDKYRQRPAKPILKDSDLSGFYFSECFSIREGWDQIARWMMKSANLSPLVDEFEFVQESWYSVPIEELNNRGNIEIRNKLDKTGWFSLTVRRIALSTEKAALSWLQTAFRFNYFSNYSGDLFEERSYTGRKIGDKCYIFREDKTMESGVDIHGNPVSLPSFETLTRSDKTLYFVKNNNAVMLHIHHTKDKEVPASWIESLAETICSRIKGHGHDDDHNDDGHDHDDNCGK